MNINNYTRGKYICRYVCFGGGYPIFRWFPRFAVWGNRLSIWWLGTEIVISAAGDFKKYC